MIIIINHAALDSLFAGRQLSRRRRATLTMAAKEPALSIQMAGELSRPPWLQSAWL